MPFDYSDLNASLQLARTRSGVLNKDAELKTDLEDSAATKTEEGGLYRYRPFLVAAMAIQQSPQYQSFRKAGDVEFTGLRETVISLFRAQQARDTASLANGWIIPPGFAVQEIVPSLFPAVETVTSSKPHLSAMVV